jgi:hypothetical protein
MPGRSFDAKHVAAISDIAGVDEAHSRVAKNLGNPLLGIAGPLQHYVFDRAIAVVTGRQKIPVVSTPNEEYAVASRILACKGRAASPFQSVE